MDDAQGADNNDGQNEPVDPASATPATPSGVSQEEYQKVLDEAQRLKDENAKRRIRAREAEQAKQQALSEQGQFKELAESLRVERDTLTEALREKESLEADAKAWQGHLKAEAKRIADLSSGLTPEQQELVAAADGNVVLQSKLVAQFSNAPAVAEPNPGGQDNTSGSVNFEGLKGAALREARAKDPAGFIAHIKQQSRDSKKPTGIRALISGKFGD